MPESTMLELIDTIQGSSYLAIEMTMGIASHQGIDLSSSVIEVTSDEASRIISFSEAARAASPDESPRLVVREGAHAAMTDHELTTFLPKRSRMKIIDRITGNNLREVQVAAKVFEEAFKVDLNHYKIEVLDKGTSHVVSFVHKDREPGTLGVVVSQPGYDVELIPKDLRVLRANFSR